jgi:hypothetical protein
VAPSDLEFVSRDPAVARVDPRGVVWSTGDGNTWIVVRAAGAGDSVPVTVAQARDSLVALADATGGILLLAPGDSAPLSCRAFDGAGRQLPVAASVVSRRGVLAGTACGALQAQRSGQDTLDITAGGYQVSLPVVVAVRPEVLTDPATPLSADSIPAGLIPWAPTLVINGGRYDLYFAGYRDAAGHLGGRRGDLHRLVSSDGDQFTYDGVVLARDAHLCSPRGTGIENVAVVPRSDAPGWRMFYAAGSNQCQGWQVFSAVSDDRSHWTPEPGIRIPNGTPPRWPAGEGMSIEQRPGGSWRMLVGSYEQLTPAEDRFQITQWTSADQLSWSYAGPVLTTRQVGPEAARSVYSPAVTDIAPGLQRMFFTGDDLDRRGGGSRIYSAVSTDGVAWQVEGVVLGGGEVDYFYSTVADDLLVFIRSAGGVHRLGSVRVRSQ